MTFILRNSLGQLQKTPHLNQQLTTGENWIPINLIDLPDGMYWLEIRGEYQSQMVKIVKKHK